MDDRNINIDGINFEVDAIDYRVVAINNHNETKISSNSGYTGNHLEIYSENISMQEVHCIDKNNNEHVFRFDNKFRKFPFREGQEIKIIFIDNYKHFLVIKNLKQKFQVKGILDLVEIVYEKKYKKYTSLILFICLLIFGVWLYFEQKMSQHLLLMIFYMAIAFGIFSWVLRFFVVYPIKWYMANSHSKRIP